MQTCSNLGFRLLGRGGRGTRAATRSQGRGRRQAPCGPWTRPDFAESRCRDGSLLRVERPERADGQVGREREPPRSRGHVRHGSAE